MCQHKISQCMHTLRDHIICNHFKTNDQQWYARMISCSAQCDPHNIQYDAIKYKDELYERTRHARIAMTTNDVS